MKKPQRQAKCEKLSQVLLTLGEGYIQMGETIQQRENHLRSVVTAWNIACLKPSVRDRAIRGAVAGFEQANAGHDVDTGVYAENLRKLIARKLKLFPGITAQVLDARIFGEKGQERVMAVSCRT